MKVLMSAYACEPGRGSEPGAGWAWACAAAQRHEVWVLTHETNRASIDGVLANEPALAERLHAVYLRNARWAWPLRRRGPSRFAYYWLWQLGPCRRASRQLHDRYGFDVCHHLTYGADWLPAGISSLPGVPLVWGPVGGSSTMNGPRTWARLGFHGFLAEAARAAVLGSLRTLIGKRVARRAALVLGQNDDVVAALAPTRVLVEPNVGLDTGLPDVQRIRTHSPPTAIYAGRLLAWKGLRLALAALRRAEATEWQLEVYGEGPQRRRLERLTELWHLSNRVRFHGVRPRAEVLEAITRADVFLFPSVHDAAGWSVAEALALGCPVLCLDTGGPPTLLGRGDGIAVGLSGDVVGGLAAGLDQARALWPRQHRWVAKRLPDVLSGIYATVAREELAA